MGTGNWRKSTASGVSGCVEVRFAPDEVRVRDTKDKNGTVLTFTPDEWRAFVSGVQLGEFDLPETT